MQQSSPIVRAEAERAREANMQFAGQMAGIQARAFSDDQDRASRSAANLGQYYLARDQMVADTSNRDADRQTSSNMQRERFQQQADLNETELSQQEKMRLARLKNSLGEIAADPTLTNDEKNEFAAQLKYKISPLEMRMTKQKMDMDRITKESMVEAKQMETAIFQQRLKAATGNASDLFHWEPDEDFLAEESERLRAEFKEARAAGVGGFATPEAEAAAIKKMAIQNSILAKRGKKFIQSSFGKWDAVDSGGGGGATGSSGKSGKEPSEKPFNRVDHYDAAERSVRDEDKRRADAGLPARTDSERGRINARLDHMEEQYELSKAKNAPPVPSEGTRPRVPAVVGEINGKKLGMAAQSGGGEHKFDPRDPKQGTDEQRGRIVEIQSKLTQRPDLDSAQQKVITDGLRELVDITGKWSGPDGSLANAPAPVKARVMEIKAAFDKLPPDPKTAKPSQTDAERVAAMRAENDAELKRLTGGKVPEGVTTDDQGRLGVWVPADPIPRTFRGDLSRLKKKFITDPNDWSDRQAADAKRAVMQANNWSDKQYDDFMRYLKGK